jgi:hypothetical protein
MNLGFWSFLFLIYICRIGIDIKCSRDFDLFVVNVEAMQERRKSFRYSVKSELYSVQDQEAGLIRCFMN